MMGAVKEGGGEEGGGGRGRGRGRGRGGGEQSKTTSRWLHWLELCWAPLITGGTTQWNRCT